MGCPWILRIKLQARLVNNLVFYLPKASCGRHGSPKTSRRDGGGGVNHPAYQVPPALILLPAEGGKIKVYICAIKYHTSFQILYSVVVEEETEAHQPPGPLFASPRLSLLSPSL